MSWLSKGLRAIGGVAARAIPGGQALEAGIKSIGGGGSFTDNLKGTLGRDASIASSAVGGGGGWMGGLKKIGNFVEPVMGGLSLYEGYKNDKKADKLSAKQLAMAEASYNERAPLRALGRDLMLNQTPPDLSYIYANSSNPFAKRGA